MSDIPELTLPVTLSDLRVYASLLASERAGENELVVIAKQPNQSFLMRLVGFFGGRGGCKKSKQGHSYSRLDRLSDVAEKATSHWMMAETLSLLNKSPNDLAQFRSLEMEIFASRARRQATADVLALTKTARKAVSVALEYCSECVNHPTKYALLVTLKLNTRAYSDSSERGFLKDGLSALAKCQSELCELDAHLSSLLQGYDLKDALDPLTQALFFDVSLDTLANHKMQGLNIHGGFARMERHLAYYQDTHAKLSQLIRLFKRTLRGYDTYSIQREERAELLARYVEKARAQLPDELMAFAVLPTEVSVNNSFIKN